ncbi:hypothetical protein NB573_00100 [Vibrio alginolyticus]|nr:hypothetical protein [Vibrio alginolyticus]
MVSLISIYTYRYWGYVRIFNLLSAKSVTHNKLFKSDSQRVAFSLCAGFSV